VTVCFDFFFSSTLTMLTNLHPSCPYLSTNNPITLVYMSMVAYLHAIVHVTVHLPTYIRISTMSITYLLTYLLKRPNFFSSLIIFNYHLALAPQCLPKTTLGAFTLGVRDVNVESINAIPVI
jgi:hypothetical protein